MRGVVELVEGGGRAAALQRFWSDHLAMIRLDIGVGAIFSVANQKLPPFAKSAKDGPPAKAESNQR